MKLKPFLFFAMILLLCGGDTFAQKKHKHKTEDTLINLLWSKIVWRTFDLTNSNSNVALLSLYDTIGNKMNFNQVIAKALKDRMVKAYDIGRNFKDMDTANVMINGDGFDVWIYGDDDAGDKGQTKDSPRVKEKGWQKMDEITDPSPDTASKYFIAEYWTFYRDVGQMTVTIDWIGPCGKEEGGGVKPLFAIKYKDLAPLLDHYTLLQYCKEGTSYSCHDFFEERQFSSKIIKVANPKDRASHDVFEY